MRAAALVGVLVGSVAFGFTGFAFSLFATSALALEFPPARVVPAVMLVGDTLILALAWEHRGRLLSQALRHVPPFAPWSGVFLLAGIAVGTLLLSGAPALVGRLALAGVLLLFVGLHGWRLSREARSGTRGAARAPDSLGSVARGPAALAALAAGILDGWLGTGGVVIAMYLAWRRLPPSPFVAGLRGYFLATDAVRLVAYGLAGYWSRSTFDLYLRVVPLALPAVVLGMLARRRWGTPAVFGRAVLAVLLCYAVALIVRTLLEG